MTTKAVKKPAATAAAAAGPRRFAPIHHPQINSPRADLRYALELDAKGEAMPEALAFAAESLFGHGARRSTTEDGIDSAASTIELLLPVLKHAHPLVRIGAVRGLSAHAYPAVFAALEALTSAPDPSPDVVAEAKKALDALEPRNIVCIQCGCDGAKLAPEPSSDPHEEQFPRAMFCNVDCAASWALDRAPDEHHLCVPEGESHVGAADECETCLDIERVGRRDDV